MGTETLPTEQETAENVTELESKIIRQVEYYFGNYNLARDKFLKEQIKLDDGWVPLETLIKFNRLKSLSEDFSVIIKALKKSPNDLLEINEEEQKVRRQVEKPMPENTHQRVEEISEKTLYVKGFQKTTTLDELLDFFKDYKSEHIYMRRCKQASKVFKGSVFVTFETKDDAEKFLDTKGIKYRGMELLKERKMDYVKRKDIYYDNIRKEKAKKLKKESEKEAEEKTETADIVVPEPEFVPGCIIKISDLGENSIREHLHEVFDSLGTVVYNDYSKGQPVAYLRFDTAEAIEVMEKLPEEDGVRKVQVGPCKATVSCLEGEEEKEYYKKIAERRARSKILNRNQKHSGNKGRFKKNWGKRQRGKGNREGYSAEPPSKKVKGERNGENEKSGASEA